MRVLKIYLGLASRISSMEDGSEVGLSTGDVTATVET